jgi:WD40 repeat protein
MHSIAVEMGGHLVEVTRALEFFIETGMPTVQRADKKDAKDLLHVLTVATFFSAVAATILQITYSLEQTSAISNVNMFFFASMIFSIGAALNSLLGLGWRQTVFGSRKNLLSLWVSSYIQGSPLLFLIASIICFSTGTIYFALVSAQGKPTQIVAILSTAMTMLGLVGAGISFLYERQVTYVSGFGRNVGLLPPEDIFDNYNDFDRSSFTPSLATAGSLHPKRIASAFRGAPMAFLSRLSQILKFLKRSKPSSELPISIERVPSTIADKQEKATPILEDPTQDTRNSALQSWQNAAAYVTRAARVLRPSPHSTSRNRLHDSVLFTPTTPGRLPVLQVDSITESQLETFTVNQSSFYHQVEISELQFSPDGSQLAVASLGEGFSIYQSGQLSTAPKRYSHRSSVDQVAWSRNGTMVACRLQTGEIRHHEGRNTGVKQVIAIYEVPNLIAKVSYERPDVSFIAWSGDDTSIFSVEGDCVFQLSTREHREPLKHCIGNIELRSISVDSAPGSSRMILLGQVPASKTYEPRRARLEKQLIVYDGISRVKEDVVPVIEDVQQIQMSCNGIDVLVSSLGKSPPQLWTLRPVLLLKIEAPYRSKLVLKHVYRPPKSLEFTGSSYFSSGKELVVMAASTVGDIIFWNRNSAEITHVISIQGVLPTISAVAWNISCLNPMMFASGSIDGTVSIWENAPAETEIMIGEQDLDGSFSSRRELAPLSSLEEEGEMKLTLKPLRAGETEVPVLEDLSGLADSANTVTLWDLPMPAAFSRPVSEDCVYGSFNPIRVYTLSSNISPRMPEEIASHDVQETDWLRLIQDLARLWAGRIPPSSKEQRKEIAVAQFLRWWNVSFFIQRGLEASLYKGATRIAAHSPTTPRPAIPAFDQAADEGFFGEDFRLNVEHCDGQSSRVPMDPIAGNFSPSPAEGAPLFDEYALYLTSVPRRDTWALGLSYRAP